MRGRGRKTSNSSNRVLDSNGPDVKVRGSASHIAEKYVNLARDATVSGDRIIAENYLQHAEHYFRIVAATQAQQTQGQHPQGQQNQNSRHNPNQSGSNDAKPVAANQENSPQPADQNESAKQGAAVKVDQASDSEEKEKSEGERRPNRPRTRTRRPRKPDVASANISPDSNQPTESDTQEKITEKEVDAAAKEDVQAAPVAEESVNTEAGVTEPDTDQTPGSDSEEPVVVA